MAGDGSERFVNSYHNERTPPQPGERPEFVAFYEAADELLREAAELARVVARAHQSAAARLFKGDWAQVRKYFSLSEKYAAWGDYRTPATGYGIHAYAHQIDRPLRLTQAELEQHPQWRGFGVEAGKHPPMRGWLVAPMIGADGENYGFIQVSDRIEGDFTEQDEAALVRLAKLTSMALGAFARVYVPEFREMGLRREARERSKPSVT